MILLVARSGSGKDFNAILNCYTMVCSNTTRPPRAGEVDGVKYHFHPLNTPFPTESQIIAKTVKNGYRYWVTWKDLKDQNGNMPECFIIDHKGVQYLRSIMTPEEFYNLFRVVFIDCPIHRRFLNLYRGRKEKLSFVIKRMWEDLFAFAGARRDADVVVSYAPDFAPNLVELIEILDKCGNGYPARLTITK